MYARITRVQFPPDRVDDLVNAFTSTALPAFEGLPGYAGHSLAIDRTGGDGQAVTFWESEQALRDSEEKATGIRTETTAAGGAGVVSVHRMEVALMERATPPSAPAFLRVIRGKGDPARLDAAVQATRDRALPVLHQQPGFRAVVVALDRSSGDMQVTGVYATAEDRENADAALSGIRSQIFQDAGAGQPQISRYEVVSVQFVGVGATAG